MISSKQKSREEATDKTDDHQAFRVFEPEAFRFFKEIGRRTSEANTMRKARDCSGVKLFNPIFIRIKELAQTKASTS